MIAIIRIAGQVNIKEKAAETLDRLRLRKKFVCVLMDETKKEDMGMLKKMKNLVAYGKINQETLTKLIKNRGKMEGSSASIKEDEAREIASEIIAGKKLKDTGLKPFFRMHPPRGGLKSSRQHYPKGILGNHGDNINKLIERML